VSHVVLVWGKPLILANGSSSRCGAILSLMSGLVMHFIRKAR
jgi:hypothetical protein